MVPLLRFQLPLPLNGPPPGYGWEECGMSASASRSFRTGVHRRDGFFGQAAYCAICGHCMLEEYLGVIQLCYILKDLSPLAWNRLKDLNWISPQANDGPRHDPRNGLALCLNHRDSFENYDCIIRYFPENRKFVLINYSDDPDLQEFHGKAIALDINDRDAPYPSLFILHEMRVRGFQPEQPLDPAIPDNITWQDWILSGGLVNQDLDTFSHDPQSMPPIQSTPPRQSTHSGRVLCTVFWVVYVFLFCLPFFIWFRCT
ncbi:hypothetical protein EV363DRAFT_811787 [Boletus edulis]|nr:hypothetical protein EV363DRAFT_811787 [Boletus edulis]